MSLSHDPLIALGMVQVRLADLPELLTLAQQQAEASCVTGAELSPLEELGCVVLRALERQCARREG